MSLLSTNAHHLLMEAAQCELATSDNVFEDEIETSFEDIWADLPELKDDIPYNEDAVLVLRTESADEVFTYAEYDNLAKYMEFSNITDVVEALDMLKEHYGLEDLGIAVDSYDEACDVMKEAKVLGKAGEKLGLAKVSSSINLIKDLKNKGIKIFKKKGEKKGKKKKK